MGKITIEIDSEDFYNNYEFFEEGDLLDNFKKLIFIRKWKGRD